MLIPIDVLFSHLIRLFGLNYFPIHSLLIHVCVLRTKDEAGVNKVAPSAIKPVKIKLDTTTAESCDSTLQIGGLATSSMSQYFIFL